MTRTQIYENESFQKILAKTEELILEKGCRNTTLKDIIERTGLSKGAIYHYVKSKDELYGLLLQSKIEEMNQQFHQTLSSIMNQKDHTKPFQLISSFFYSRQSVQDVSNLIFVYLLSNNDEQVKKIWKEIYQYSKEVGLQWITIGQEHGVIPSEIDAEKMTELFLVYSYGLRVSQIITPNDLNVEMNDIFQLLIKSLA